ncbi:MAG: helix-turn-helix domain-containing protein [Candidatus Roizmanbacteria bacterium]
MINTTNMLNDQYYSIEEVAKTLKVAYLTVYRWIRSGKLVALKAGKQYRIAKDELEKFMIRY